MAAKATAMRTKTLKRGDFSFCIRYGSTEPRFRSNRRTTLLATGSLPLKFHRLWLVKMADMVGGVSSNAHRLFYPKKCLTRQPLSPSRGEGARRLPVIENPRRIA